MKFAIDHTDATVMIFPVHGLFHRVLDHPTEYGFDEATAHVENGSIWFDFIHITSGMHGAVADALADFLALRAPVQGLEQAA